MTKGMVVEVFDPTDKSIYSSDRPVRPGAIARAVQDKFRIDIVDLEVVGHPLEPVVGRYRACMVITVEDGETSEVSGLVTKIKERSLLERQKQLR